MRYVYQRKKLSKINNDMYIQCEGTLLVAQLFEALRYKPEGRGFDSR